MLYYILGLATAGLIYGLCIGRSWNTNKKNETNENYDPMCCIHGVYLRSVCSECGDEDDVCGLCGEGYEGHKRDCPNAPLVAKN